MLNAIKRWISGEPPGPDWGEVSSWAQKQGFGFKRAKEEEGFVLEGTFGDRPWRLEWGAPQRAYITTHELRLRMELQLPSGLQMLIMTRSLLEMLERETFERYTESNQTLIDVSTPEEMRWLAMFPKVNLDLPKDVRVHYGSVAADPMAALQWVDAELGQQLENASLNLLRDQPPFVLMTLRGRVYMRLQLSIPEPERLQQALALFKTAAAGAMRAGGSISESQNQEWPTTASTAWQTDLMPEDPKVRG
ncbi:MAG: hypothetical protein JF606_22445 [Burkholderiales bacterium]|jgi:hypothetical protein|nr:hypothetical protein [Burkholderiales bacterium]